MKSADCRRWRSMIGSLKLPSTFCKKGKPKGAPKITPRELREVRLALKAAAQDWERDYRALVQGDSNIPDEDAYESVSSDDEIHSQDDSSESPDRGSVDTCLKGSAIGTSSRERNIGTTEKIPSLLNGHGEGQPSDLVGENSSRTSMDSEIVDSIAAGLRRLPGAQGALPPILKAIQDDVYKMCKLIATAPHQPLPETLVKLRTSPPMRNCCIKQHKDDFVPPVQVIVRAYKRALAVTKRVNQDWAEKANFKTQAFRKMQNSLFCDEVLEPIVKDAPSKYPSVEAFLPEPLRNLLLVLYCSVQEMADDPGELVEVEHVLGVQRRRTILTSLRAREYRLLKSLVAPLCSTEVLLEEEPRTWRLLGILRTARCILLASQSQLESHLGREASSFLRLFGLRKSRKDRENLCLFLGLDNSSLVINALETEFGSIDNARRASLETILGSRAFKNNKVLGYDVFRRLSFQNPGVPVSI